RRIVARAGDANAVGRTRRANRTSNDDARRDDAASPAALNASSRSGDDAPARARRKDPDRRFHSVDLAGTAEARVELSVILSHEDCAESPRAWRRRRQDAGDS